MQFSVNQTPTICQKDAFHAQYLFNSYSERAQNIQKPFNNSRDQKW